MGLIFIYRLTYKSGITTESFETGVRPEDSMFDFLPEILRTPLAFLLVLGTLVFIHELGHYLAARWCGVHVETFSLGFGPVLVAWTDRRGTRWKLACLPLGGYVKLHGRERPQDASEATKAGWLPGRTFHGKPLSSRAIVIVAGPAANFLLAAVLFCALYAIVGHNVAVPVVGTVAADSAASRGGLKVGDRIATIEGRPIARFEEIQRAAAASPGRALHLTVVSNGLPRDLTVTPDARAADGHAIGVLGIAGGTIEHQRLSLWQAVPAGLAQTWGVTRETVIALGRMIGGGGNDELSGPLGIAMASGQMAAVGVVNLIVFIAVLSVSFGVFNLFPIPLLDGGHLLFYFADSLRGRPLPVRVQEYGFRGSMALLGCLLLFATWNDLGRSGILGWVAGLIG